MSRTYPSGAPKPHKGVDISANVGDAVVAYKSGTVVHSGVGNSGINGGFGKYIVLEHDVGNGKYTYSLYAHLKSNYVQVGSQIVEGSVIGAVGRTGNLLDAVQTHLHFELQDRDQGDWGGVGRPLSDFINPSDGFSLNDKIREYFNSDLEVTGDINNISIGRSGIPETSVDKTRE